jgi:hydroxymethylglutaryl-CoA lyase
MALPASVRVVEVGPRDGLQNEKQAVPAATKAALVERLASAGLPMIETGSFVSPKWVPVMADSAEVFRLVKRRPGTRYSALTPNMQGFDAALAAGADEVAVFAAASETFSRRNINCSIAESLDRFAPVCVAAKARGVPVRGYVSCVLGCPYEGAIAPAAVADVAERLMTLGCYEVSLGDTIGVGTPGAAQAMIRAVAARVPMDRLAAHFHDTYGQALANAYAVMELGTATLDSSIAGLGGCPYARGATGNVATEDVIFMLDGLGVHTGIDLGALIGASWFIADALGRPPDSKVARARGRPGEERAS